MAANPPLPIPPPPPKQLSVVTLGMLDGHEETGQIPMFSPRQPDIQLVPLPSATEGPKARMIPVERIAYVAFPRDPNGGTSGMPQRGLKPFTLRCVGGRQFEVEADPTGMGNPIGFFAYSARATDPYHRIFFYAHGLIAREDPTPLGKLLVSDNRVTTEQLQVAANHEADVPGNKLGQILVEQHGLSATAVNKALDLQVRKKTRLGETLIEAGLLTKDQLESALNEQKRRRDKRIGELLIELGFVSEEDLCKTLSNKFLIPYVDLSAETISTEAAREIPVPLIEKYGVLPIAVEGDVLTLAISDPLAVDGLQAVKLHYRRPVKEVIARPSQLRRFVAETLSRIEWESLEGGLNDGLQDEEKPKPDEIISESDSTIVKLVNRIILDAYKAGASDIHFEPNGPEDKVVIRFRVDGDCQFYQELPPTMRQPVTARIKIMAKLDISERRKPQDGKITLKNAKSKVELRVATVPTVGDNEDVVLRILASSKPQPIDRMDFSERNLTELKAAISKPYGLFLVVGPTGSGKTTTLHSVLGHLNTPDMKIWTAEDPVEITQKGMRQVQMAPKIGLTFATALRAFLRADPDVVMVGEMRDHETASIGVEASLTGHIVFSTLHTNSAPETITRLIDMGLDPFSFADALLGVLAQRLARRLCSGCKSAYEAPKEEVTQLADLYGVEAFHARFPVKPDGTMLLYRSSGCEACGKSGYKGRVPLHELLVNNEGLKTSIAQKLSIEELRKSAIANGMTTLLQDGIAKCVFGHTDVKQVLAVAAR